jgi:acetoin utilization deacetylase AcuC-like enzyme
MIGFFSSPRFVEHDTGPHHPERPDRIRAIYSAVCAAGLLPSPNPFPDFQLPLPPLPTFNNKLVELPFAPADPKWLFTVHNPAYAERIEHVCKSGGGVLDQGDTIVSPPSCDIALLALGGVLAACDAVMQGQVQRAFAAIRPPGHHAEPDRPMGFCLFSNIAIAARYIQKTYEVERVAIVDFDVHHGNGTQACLQDDPSVLFISMHQDPRSCYPGSGYAWETGVGAGRGYTLNIPFNPGAGDEEYQRAMDERVIPRLDEFKPQVLLVSAGFDAHADDPLAQINLTDDAFESMTRSLAEVADQHCGGRLISALEGGYNLQALGRCAICHLIGLGAS